MMMGGEKISVELFLWLCRVVAADSAFVYLSAVFAVCRRQMRTVLTCRDVLRDCQCRVKLGNAL
ncbi:hypothetical protein E2C01_034077 [Portunus trituberculatus]|uniref:Uncharacterized protein n=1 Tax=Portunus trituberculatus TaxID=210409 RepID=A0A5B7F4N8_PORTR|nr:hypothetical protein [Portunus trituberculatus]